MAKLKDKGFFTNQPEPDLDESRYRHTAGKKSTTSERDVSTSRNQKDDNANSSTSQRSVGRPRNSDTVRSSGARHGLQRGYTRFSVVADEDLLQWFRDYAYTERMTMREALEAALHMYKDAQEKAGITIIPDPKRRIVKE